MRCIVKDCPNEGGGKTIMIPDENGSMKQGFICAPCYTFITEGLLVNSRIEQKYNRINTIPCELCKLASKGCGRALHLKFTGCVFGEMK